MQNCFPLEQCRCTKSTARQHHMGAREKNPRNNRLKVKSGAEVEQMQRAMEIYKIPKLKLVRSRWGRGIHLFTAYSRHFTTRIWENSLQEAEMWWLIFCPLSTRVKTIFLQSHHIDTSWGVSFASPIRRLSSCTLCTRMTVNLRRNSFLARHNGS